MTKPDILRDVMRETRTTQIELSRLSGVHQPSISEFLSERVRMSDDMLERLLSCMGYQLEIVRSPKRVEMDRHSRRRWLLHRQLLEHLTPGVWPQWRVQIDRNLERLRRSTQGQPHERNLDHWQRLIENDDLSGLRRVMLDTSQDGIGMREVSPLSGLLPETERQQVLEMLQS